MRRSSHQISRYTRRIKFYLDASFSREFFQVEAGFASKAERRLASKLNTLLEASVPAKVEEEEEEEELEVPPPEIKDNARPEMPTDGHRVSTYLLVESIAHSALALH